MIVQRLRVEVAVAREALIRLAGDPAGSITLDQWRADMARAMVRLVDATRRLGHAEDAAARGQPLAHDDDTLQVVAERTGWRLDTWSSGARCLRKPCGRVASDSEIEAVLRTIAEAVP